MGLGGISPGSLLLILLIILVLFGTKKLRTIGEDLGIALRSFKKGLHGTDEPTVAPEDASIPTQINAQSAEVTAKNTNI